MSTPYPGGPYVHSGAKRGDVFTQDGINELGDTVAALTTAVGNNPQGTGGAADLSARVAAVEATLAVTGNTGYRGLFGSPGTTANTQARVEAALLSVEGSALESLDVTADLTVTGKNGRDAGVTRAADTQYYVWVGLNPTTLERCTLISLDPARTALVLSHATLSGFTKFRRVRSLRTNASQNFVLAYQQDDVVLYDYASANAVVNAVGTNSWVTQTLAFYVPPTSRQALLAFDITAGAVGLNTLQVRPNGSSLGHIIGACTIGSGGAEENVGQAWVPTNASQEIQWNSSTTTATNTIYVAGYRDAI